VAVSVPMAVPVSVSMAMPAAVSVTVSSGVPARVTVTTTSARNRERRHQQNRRCENEGERPASHARQYTDLLCS
jgi:hypothetical protein